MTLLNSIMQNIGYPQLPSVSQFWFMSYLPTRILFSNAAEYQPLSRLRFPAGKVSFPLDSGSESGIEERKLLTRRLLPQGRGDATDRSATELNESEISACHASEFGL